MDYLKLYSTESIELCEFIIGSKINLFSTKETNKKIYCRELIIVSYNCINKNDLSDWIKFWKECNSFDDFINNFSSSELYNKYSLKESLKDKKNYDICVNVFDELKNTIANINEDELMNYLNDINKINQITDILIKRSYDESKLESIGQDITSLLEKVSKYVNKPIIDEFLGRIINNTENFGNKKYEFIKKTNETEILTLDEMLLSSYSGTKFSNFSRLDFKKDVVETTTLSVEEKKLLGKDINREKNSAIVISIIFIVLLLIPYIPINIKIGIAIIFLFIIIFSLIKINQVKNSINSNVMMCTGVIIGYRQEVSNVGTEDSPLIHPDKTLYYQILVNNIDRKVELVKSSILYNDIKIFDEIKIIKFAGKIYGLAIDNRN